MKTYLYLVVVVVLTGCTDDNDAAPDAIRVDTLYTNAVVWTGLPAAPDKYAMAIKDRSIVFVGDSANDNVVATETVDLDGRFVMPGFADNHVHFLEGGAALASVDLRDAASPEIFSQRIADYASTLPTGRWVLNGNWDHESWGGELPRKDWIDGETGDNPVFVFRLDGHMALANSAALRIAGIAAGTVAPDGGEIVTDDQGQPTGILKGNALNLVLAVIPKPSDDQIIDMFRMAQDHALSLGLTKVHAVTAGPTETSLLDEFRLAENEGLMKIRAFVSTPIESWQDTARVIERFGNGAGRLRWGGVKGFVDGSLGSTTAWFYEPYADAPGTSGSPLTDPATLKTLMRDADNSGLRLSIHAIGDRAIDQLIADFRDIAGNDIASRRYRIEHFQHPTVDAISAAEKSGIVASMQPYHAIDDGRWAEKRIGPQRIRTTYAFRSILDAGGILTFGSDWPVAPLSPLEGVYAAVTRRTTDGANPDGWQPQEKITVDEALRAYTVSNAYADFEEDVAGTLEAGKRADFVVLSDDPRAVDPSDIRKIRVLRTVIDGEVVYDAEESASH